MFSLAAIIIIVVSGEWIGIAAGTLFGACLAMSRSIAVRNHRAQQVSAAHTVDITASVDTLNRQHTTNFIAGLALTCMDSIMAATGK